MACLFSLLLALGFGVDPDAKGSPRFTGDAIPLPPAQAVVWEPPATELPPAVVEAMTLLFQQGLADPRGCEYREIAVVTGGDYGWGDGGVVRTHGWVLPGDAPHFAVCWNGLVYPAVSVGDAADVARDAEVMLKATTQGFGEAWTEVHQISAGHPLPMKAAMLLRLGRGDLAARLWENDEKDKEMTDPYGALASEWLWSLFNRAVCAHMRGDDALALLSARALEKYQRAVKAEMPTHGESDAEKRLLGFLRPLPELLADQERRAAEKPHELALARTDFPTKADRITALIGDLDEVNARQWGQPGGVWLGGDPIVQALIAEGDEAVEPLLRCLEEDARLTRSVRFWRNSNRSRTILGAHEAAQAALEGILRTSFFEEASTGDSLTARGMEGRKGVAAQIRAHWEKYRGVALAERWYLILKNDEAEADEWRQAIANIVQPADVRVLPGVGVTTTVTPTRARDAEPALSGETLRDGREPSVGDLMARRIREMTLLKDDAWDRNLRATSEAALALARWEGPEHLADLREFSRALVARFGDGGKSHAYLTEPISSLFVKRVALGDAEALDEYAQWIVGTTPEELDLGCVAAFLPMGLYPEHPAIARAAATMFAAEGSAWVPLIRKGGTAYHVRELFQSPLVGVPGFREELLRGLRDRSPAGEVILRPSGTSDMEVTEGWGTSGGLWRDDPLAPAAGTKHAFRMCDLYAHEISKLPGSPKCALYWPVARRDEGVAECVSFLRKYGDRYRPEPREEARLFRIERDRATMRFPRLDHPATPEEAARGLAIFTLPGETRVAALPAFPMPATWKNLDDDPFMLGSADGKQTLSHSRSGTIWQAEEVLVDGRWQRFYGFVSRYRVAKVPAEELEFDEKRRD